MGDVEWVTILRDWIWRDWGIGMVVRKVVVQVVMMVRCLEYGVIRLVMAGGNVGSGPRSKYTKATYLAVELEQVRITLPYLIMDERYSKDNMG